MASSNISSNLRKLIEDDSQHRCGYCLTQASFVPMRFEIEHIIPERAGGKTEPANLYLSCPSCNSFKGIKVEAIDPETLLVSPLFNPRAHNWFEHFRWSGDGTRVIGLTSIGRATIVALKLNHDWWIKCRAEWVLRGNFPPKE
jgi:hypothetical protein